MNTAAPDLNSTPPRSGREMLGRYSWLARLADKVRAEQAGTDGDYIAYCGLSMGFLDRAGIPKETFDDLVRAGTEDSALSRYFDEHVSDEQRDSANHYVLDDMSAHLDKQVAEERRPPA